MSRLYLGDEAAPWWRRAAGALRRVNRGVWVFVSGFAAGAALMLVAAGVGRDPGRFWDVMWEPVGLPTWVLLGALILVMALRRRGEG